MKRIGIVTLLGHVNYGNRLQNYALQAALESYGFSVHTIDHSKYHNGRITRLFDILRKPPTLILSLIYKKLASVLRLAGDSEEDTDKTSVNIEALVVERVKALKAFDKRFIHFSEVGIRDRYIPKALSRSFDYFVVGSDQVWHPDYGLHDPLRFLSFAAPKQRIAYSASFGVSKIPEDTVALYKRGLSSFRKLSCREQEGQQIIREIIGREVEYFVDPTMLLSPNQWRRVAKKALSIPSKPYLVVFFLGPVHETEREFIHLKSNEFGLDIVGIDDVNDISRFAIGPEEFIDYIDNASLVLTNSFHGTVFSILFEKPFVVFERVNKSASMNSRLSTLLQTFNLENRQFSHMVNAVDIMDIDFSHVSKILMKEREKAETFLKTSFFAM